MRFLKTSWIDGYMKYTEDHESPPAFHHWTALAMIAAALERFVWVKVRGRKTYPNLYTVLVSDSGVCRKSSAQDEGWQILQEIEDTPFDIGNKLTPQGMWELLSKRKQYEVDLSSDGPPIKTRGESQGLLYSTELASLFGADAYKNGFMQNITDLYICHNHWKYNTKGGGDVHLWNVCLNIFGSSTTQWLRTSIPPDAVGGGFIGRFMLVHADRPRKRPFFDLSPDADKREEERLHLKKALIADLSLIRTKLRGEYTVTPEGMGWFNDWYIDWQENPPKGLLGSYISRRHTTLLKVAMILAASSYDKRLITKAVLEGAHATLVATEGGMPQIVDKIGATMTGSDIQKVLGYIDLYVEITRSELTGKCSHIMNTEQLEVVLKTLAQGNKVKRFIRGEGRGATEVIRSLKKTEEVNEDKTFNF